jgi:hypothetical protein
MPITTKVLIGSVSLLVMLTIVSLVRQKRLDEKYALLWLAAGATMMMAPFATGTIDALSNALGFHYAPAFVLLMAFLGLCLINLQYSVVISRLNKQNRGLAQRVAIMELRVSQMER